jgi:hypothetical protein
MSSVNRDNVIFYFTHHGMKKVQKDESIIAFYVVVIMNTFSNSGMQTSLLKGQQHVSV